MEVELVKSFRIEAAHHGPSSSEEDGLHGHSFEIQIGLAGECDADFGWLVDYAEISDAFRPVFDALDHQNLNEVLERDEVCESDLGVWISNRLEPEIPAFKFVTVRIMGGSKFEVESKPADPVFELPERLAFGFEAAHALPALPDSHKCSRMHGHSFRAEVGAPELERLRESLATTYQRLDRRCLNRIDGLSNPTSEMLAHWIWRAVAADGHELSAVVVAETCTARCVYRGG